ncbi:unnamed protein product [Ilex paraguariensis]|uniref:Uncharacterized protein n=1 Tax=Ilex paraguariensis TaxID=185542 RepID=A0ABC8QVG6_9AQUA
MDVNQKEKLTLVARKACFGLPTACPTCLPVYIYLRFAQVPFDLDFNLMHPDSGPSLSLSLTYSSRQPFFFAFLPAFPDKGLIELRFLSALPFVINLLFYSMKLPDVQTFVLS